MTYFIALICLLLPSYLVRFSILGIPTTLLEVLIYVAAIISLIKFLIPLRADGQKSKIQVVDKKIFIPIFLFFLAGIISIFVSPDKKEALGLFKAFVFDPIVFFFVVIYNVKDKKQVDLIIKALILSGFLVAIHAIYQKLTGQLTSDNRVIGIFGYSPNYLALYLAPIAVLTSSYSFMITRKGGDGQNYMSKYIWVYDLALLAMLWAILLSGSRAAFAATLVGIASYLVIKYWTWIKERKIIVTLLYCSVVILLVVGWFFVKPNWQLSSEEGGRITSSNNIRWEIWKTTVNDIIFQKSNWLVGVGLGNYQNYFTELTKDRVNYPEWISPLALTPHNLFLTIWVNLGLLGLIAFVWILIMFFSSKSDSKFLNNTEFGTYGLVLIAVMIAILLQGLVDSPYWKNDLSVFFWILIALMLKIKLLEIK
jgi:putative inorganic carbon (HCO3(-)) transporter